MTYLVKIKAYGNPDKGQDPSRLLYGVKPVTLKSETLSDLVEQVQEWQLENCVGSGNWAFPPVFKDGKPVGSMSYNGRVWVEKTKEQA